MFLYTREAHPGERFPAHASLEQKIEHARQFIDRYGIQRPVLVDDLDGTLHRQYGMLPNMTYIVSSAGRVLFRSDWTDPPTIEAAVTYIQSARTRRRSGLRLKPFFAEFVGYRWTDDPAFQAGLHVAGPQAVSDFAEAMERWSSGVPLKGGITIEE
ncbi:hypothetical protein BH23CHL5_BH23CHL5_25780 [soil metagenome]